MSQLFFICRSIHEHRVITVECGTLLLNSHSLSSASQQLSPDLRRNRVVAVGQQQVQQRLSLILAQVVSVSLGECQKILVEDDGQRLDHVSRERLALLDGCRVHTSESQEMEDERVDDLVRKGVLLL